MTTILVIAGTDSSGGAGLSRDTAISTALHCSVRPVVTAVTVQTDKALSAIQPMPAGLVAAQIRAALSDDTPRAVKIGMTATPAIAEAIFTELQDCALPIVIDPVLDASSGGRLTGGAPDWRLLRLARLLTPNLPEAAALTHSLPVEDDADIAAQAHQILDRGVGAVLVKGGHGAGNVITDHLFQQGSHIRLSCTRIARGRRGTGCALSTAIACHLARGMDLGAACHAAKEHVTRWIGGEPLRPA
ncbi:hydroxymethylpyrimidine/phosphomethylpyrimidine kinase [Paracoccus aurantiacus]|uniref:hydroxymethylpyrimidine kinase n=1 Tax=Paracoccus aurantiacus TaxID=2599412 RepID=A0A5C6S2Q1_9RHOB|nr:hydroxymethylpyrimidine/phosphomethylpyrimidine kinase [Paracoccus aurantiacus]TXB68209.1 hydroxymethylpyrimidine/phosphomethylpyrimidine kinase [Paracoccus aurantiacus]